MCNYAVNWCDTLCFCIYRKIDCTADFVASVYEAYLKHFLQVRI